MKSWLHWIGNAYYSIDSFINEALSMGVSRRIPKHILKVMDWGDRAYCVSRLPTSKNPYCFGYFTIDTIHGIKTTNLPDEIKDKIEVKWDGPIMTQQRGCGTVQAGGFYAYTSSSVEELAEYGDEPQVQGGFKVFPEPWPQFWKMPPFRGFRRFNHKGFLEDILASPGRPRLKSFYYEVSED